MGISNVPAIPYEVEGMDCGVSSEWTAPGSSPFATCGPFGTDEQVILFSGIGWERQAIPMITRLSARYAKGFPYRKRWGTCAF
ncbi:hypothetical protein GCM10018953_17160 [Streptosporangium nondiastaticum]